MTYSNFSLVDSGMKSFWTVRYFLIPTLHLNPVFNHELLHALGLEHPFDDTDGDFYLVETRKGATTDETVMSYIVPENLYTRRTLVLQTILH